MKAIRSPSRHAGFSLIELMVVVAIVAILAAIVYPNYTDTVRRSNRSDARATLLQIAQSLERYFTENNTYAGATLGTAAATDVWPTTTSTENRYTISFSVAPSATAYTLRATATGFQDKDTECATMTLSHLGVRAPAACW
ncbi:MAG: type IV pilin protein [Gammaproteobacteria bacterium]|nr:type IV pilin protein [Gammaproteobacteria bacterium]